MQKPPLENNFISDNGDHSLKSESEIAKLLTELKHINAATKLFENVMNSALPTSIIPVVYAAPEQIITKPPKMKYKDLPVYQCPHFEYKNHMAEQQKCPDVNVKLLHKKLFPIVHSYRPAICNSIDGLRQELCDISKEIYVAICDRTKCFKTFMRDPENMTVRRAVVGASTLTGLWLGSGSRNINKKLFFSSLGALAGGALCFPKETDEIFRNVSYNFGKCMIAVFNLICKQNYALKERLPCPDDLPPTPKELPSSKRDKKCEKKK